MLRITKIILRGIKYQLMATVIAGRADFLWIDKIIPKFK